MRIIKLTDEFYSEYASCSEILQKKDRPYYCVEVFIQGKTFAIPFRHHIKHKYCFHTIGEAGLDYTKAVIILSENYVSEDVVRVESKEYNLIKGKNVVIANGMRKYLQLYLKSKTFPENEHYKTIASCSSLQYFL